MTKFSTFREFLLTERKKPDADGDGIPDWADKDCKGKKETKADDDDSKKSDKAAEKKKD